MHDQVLLVAKYSDPFTDSLAKLNLSLKLPCAFLPQKTKFVLDSNQKDGSLLSSVQSGGCGLIINVCLS
jgi:hypothetical protein